MEYKEEYEKDYGVIKHRFSKGTLFFVPSGEEGFYEFCSDNEELQKWCKEAPEKGLMESHKIRLNQHRHVSDLANDFLHGEPYGTRARESTHIEMEYAKGEVVDFIPEDCLVIDTGGVPVSAFDGLKDPDEIYRHSIAMGVVDHHTIDMLPEMDGQPKKCATQMAVDYHDDIAQYCSEGAMHYSLLIHRDPDLDALCAAWIIRERMARDKLPAIAPEMAEIVNKVDYAEYRIPPKEYLKSFAGCMGAMLAEGGRDSEYGNEINPELLKVLDVLAAEKEQNPQFDLQKTDIRAFIENSPLISDKAKEMMRTGLERMEKNQQQFTEDVKNAKIVKFNFHNPQTNRVETGQMVIMSSANPLAATNLGYSHFGKNTIMAVYGGDKRKAGDMYDIGIAPEAAGILSGLMKDICVAMNKAEGSKREQAARIKEGLEQLPIRTPKEEKHMTDIKEIMKTHAQMAQRLAFSGADAYGLIDRDPSPLVARDTLVPASRTSLMSESNFVKTLTNWANSTRVGELLQMRHNSAER